jgi:hypothetical protein
MSGNSRNLTGLLEPDDSKQLDFDDIDDTILFVIRALQALHHKQRFVASDLRKVKLSQSTPIANGYVGSNKSSFGDIGCLLTVHNGHNGWLGKAALHQFLNHIVDKILFMSQQVGGNGNAY